MRTAEITRSTKETQITVWLSLDGGPVAKFWLAAVRMVRLPALTRNVY